MKAMSLEVSQLRDHCAAGRIDGGTGTRGQYCKPMMKSNLLQNVER
jgi:hypothetical protein